MSNEQEKFSRRQFLTGAVGSLGLGPTDGKKPTQELSESERINLAGEILRRHEQALQEHEARIRRIEEYVPGADRNERSGGKT